MAPQRSHGAIRTKTQRSRVSSDDVDALVDFVNGAINVAESALLQALRKAVVFLVSNILMSFFEELFGAMETASVIETGVDRRMIIQIFAIVDGGFLDFVDGIIDGVNGFFVTEFATIMAFEMSASGAKIAESVKISGMLALSEGLARCERDEQGEDKSDNRKSSDRLPRHEFSLMDWSCSVADVRTG
jgi:hypothetical protein